MYTHSSCVTTSPHQHRWCCVLLHTYLGVPPQTPIQPTPVQMPFQVMPVTHPSHFTRVWGRGVHARCRGISFSPSFLDCTIISQPHCGVIFILRCRFFVSCLDTHEQLLLFSKRNS